MESRNLISSKLDLSLLVIRSTIGMSFLAHGIAKILTFSEAAAFFGSLGLSSWWLVLVLVAEICGGLAFIAGVCVEWFGIILATIMLVSVVLVTMVNGISHLLEINLVLLFLSIALSFNGPGLYTVKQLFVRKAALN
jgi:uncharacterized membrane protein YphA (DoxX/SURF4 family)